jgi:hypothetical protein
MSPTRSIYMINVRWHQTLQVIQSMSGVDRTYIAHTSDEKLHGISYRIQYKISVGKSEGEETLARSSIDCNI